MKLIYDPEVYLIAHPTILPTTEHGLREFLRDHNISDWYSDAQTDADLLPEVAGRLCYMSFSNPRPGGNRVYLERIKECGHGSVLEHVNWTMIFTGISRTCTHELVRHRAGVAYSQLSQRYVDESTAEFVVPWELQEEVRAAEVYRESMKTGNPIEGTEQIGSGLDWLHSMEQAQNRYIRTVGYLFDKIERDAYIKWCKIKCIGGPVDKPDDEWRKSLTQLERTEMRKAARQAARSILPNATETKIMVTANARAWRHMIEMRASRHAEKEIRRLFCMVLAVLKEEAPSLFADYSFNQLPDLTLEVITKHRKV